MIKKIFLVFSLCFTLGCLTLTPVYGENDYSEEREDLKNSIVEVKAGLTDDKGEFNRLKYASGILLVNNTNEAIILTSYHSINITSQEKKQFAKSKKISKDYLNSEIFVVIRGDVDSPAASIIAENRTKDYCILRIESVIQDRKAALLGDSDELFAGDTVYAYGFTAKDSADATIDFVKENVSVNEGVINNPRVSIKGRNRKHQYIAHSCVIDKGYTGGALVNEQGFVIGMNNLRYGKDQGYALPINEVKMILSGRGMQYIQKRKQSLMKKLHFVLGCVIGGLFVIVLRLLLWLRRARKSQKQQTKEAEEKEQDLKTNEATVDMSDSQDIYSLFLREAQTMVLTRMRTHKSVTITNPKFKLGRSSTQVDYTITDNPTIGREHAIILWENNQYYIKDLHSANGTFVNGHQVYDDPVLLTPGCEIVLANETFVFTRGF